MKAKKKIFLPAAVDRRQFRRVMAKDDFLVEFHRDRSPLTKERIGYGRDLSLEGVRFATIARLKEKDRLKMVLYFPQGFPGPRKINLQLEVVRIHQPDSAERFRVGCKLIHSNVQTRETIRQYMKWIEKSRH